jgi:hypothetical protein
MDGEIHPREPSILGSSNVAGCSTGRAAAQHPRRAAGAVRGRGVHRYLPPPGYGREPPARRWWRNQEAIMAKRRSRWRLLVGRIKNLLRRVRTLTLAIWVLKILYEVAKFFDMFH